MENFFGLLKSELFYFEKFESIEDFREKLDEYIDYYNNWKIKVKLKGLSPVEYRTKSFNYFVQLFVCTKADVKLTPAFLFLHKVFSYKFKTSAHR